MLCLDQILCTAKRGLYYYGKIPSISERKHCFGINGHQLKYRQSQAAYATPTVVLTTRQALAMAMSDSLLTSTPDLLESPQSPQSEAEVDTPTDHITTAPSVFDQTTDNLLRLGSLTLDKFAQDPSEELDGFDIPLDAANPNPTAYYFGDTTATRANKDEEDIDEIPIVSPSDAVRFLRDATQKEFGSTSYDPLKFEYIEELGQTGMCHC